MSGILKLILFSKIKSTLTQVIQGALAPVILTLNIKSHVLKLVKKAFMIDD
jgi:hypothetical protein